LETIQRQLSEYLQCELYHLLGAYGVAEEHLDGLIDRLPDTEEKREGRAETAATVLAELVELSRDFNHKLSWQRYATDPRSRSNPSQPHSTHSRGSAPEREPMPEKLPMTNPKRFTVGPRDQSMARSRENPWSTDEDWGRIARFYAEAIAALRAHREIVGVEGEDRYRNKDKDRARQINFARSLLAPRDGESRLREGQPAREHLERRLHRYKQRLYWAVDHIGGARDGDRQAVLRELKIDLTGTKRSSEQEEFLKLIMEDEPTSGEESLSVFVLRVQAEAHLSMHAVEAWRGMCLGENAKVVGRRERKWLEDELRRSIALDTFAFCAGRTAPWLFARSDAERTTIVRDVATAWENVVPLRSMWIATQISLLALHRRAYARALQEQPASPAYDDYHKLQYLIRDAQRRIEGAPLQVEGARGFLAGLNAEAHHHIGELYRSEHAHKPALEHFEAASHRLGLLRDEDPTFDKVLRNSRWHVELQISRGKACYEMGRHKEALCWHLKAWLSFLELLSSETETGTNTQDIVEAIDWLESVKFEPELRKSEISEWVGPVVEQLDRISPVGRLGALAAEILLRLGHLLFVLNIGGKEGTAEERVRSTLAFGCLAKAAECDPYSTLIGTDLLKMRFRFNRFDDRELRHDGDRPDDGESQVGDHLTSQTLKPIAGHWPRGGSDYERLARAAEYLMLKSRKGRFTAEVDEDDPEQVDGLVARDLLLDLFMSTDSINVRKSQIHRFLMEGKIDGELPCGDLPERPEDDDPAAIEFVCMRRYSSPFPLLPRPSAFRALGGGYFVRLHDPEWQRKTGADGPYGVVVDPGVDFVENLYRTGYSLGDVDMVVLTHDHVDHLGALDPLLSLLHVRSQILKNELRKDDAAGKAEKPPAKKVVVLTSSSVAMRYSGVKKLSAEDAKNFAFHCFEQHSEAGQGEPIPLPEELRFPAGFELLSMISTAGGEPKEREDEKDGHRDLSNQPSHGVCLRRKDEPKMAVAICSDTPPPPPEDEWERREEWERTWAPALDAGILVVHLGSVPLTELRRMDDFEEGQGLPRKRKEKLKKEEKKLRRLQKALQDADPELSGQIEYAQWLRSHMPPDEEKEPIAPVVGRVSQKWLPPPEHNYLVGLLRWARRYREPWAREGAEALGPRRQGLFVIGELSEELGTMRGKVATRLNHRIFGADGEWEAREKEPDRDLHPYALTADIGLHACVLPGGEGELPRVQVLCTTCNLDTDRTPNERYHPCHDVYEVCVKGENEGIFYNCLEHDPARQDEPAFLEQLERFDIFGR
jgi:Metallo-beta-lactamase superfamily